jgi:hypothetical protein
MLAVVYERIAIIYFGGYLIKLLALLPKSIIKYSKDLLKLLAKNALQGFG